MFFYLKGRVKIKGEKFLVLEVNGIGYQIFVSNLWLETIKEGQEIQVFTYLYFREDVIELYGFQNQEEQEFFKQLKSITGIGPKSALGILSLGGLNEIKSSIVNDEIDYLTKVSGIGRKTAERIIFELKNKIKNLEGKIIEKSGKLQVKEALANLGYKNREIENVLDKIPKAAEKVEDKIRHALKFLGKR